MTAILKFIGCILIKAIPTLVGAVLAFFLGFRLYKKQKREEKKAYLHYSAATLSYLTNHLYTFKGQIAQKRYEEAKKLKDELESNASPSLKLHETVQYIYGGDFQLAVQMEKLDFLVEKDPNLIILLGFLINSIKSLNHILTNINNEISEYSRQMPPPTIPPTRIMLTLQKNELLYEQLDSSIYLTEKFLDLLIRFGQLEYGKEMKIKSLEFTDEKYQKLKPKPIQSWEGYDWLPEKASQLKKCVKKIQARVASKKNKPST